MTLRAGATVLATGGTVHWEDGLAEFKAGAVSATVNEVEVHGLTALRLGDVISQGEYLYLLLPGPRTQDTSPRLLDHFIWTTRLDEEATAGERHFAVLLGRSGAFASGHLAQVLHASREGLGTRTLVAPFGRDLAEFLVVGADSSYLEALREALSVAATVHGETIRWGAAWFPSDGATGEELWAAAVDRLLGLEVPGPSDLVWGDPCMTRLLALSDRWSGRSASLSVVGEEGVGRESIARYIRLRGAPNAPFIVHRASRFDRQRWAEDVARAAGGALHLRRPEILMPEERGAFWGATAFRASAGERYSSRAGFAADELVVPALADRPSDVGTIAESVLHAVDSRLARRRSILRVETRTLLLRQPGTENVRSLRNLVIRGALAASGAEVRPEHLEMPHRIPAEGSQGVRARVREVERRTIESALEEAGWNVAEAARQMDLPRRTLVYRMARLGLRRPRRG